MSPRLIHNQLPISAGCLASSTKVYTSKPGTDSRTCSHELSLLPAALFCKSKPKWQKVGDAVDIDKAASRSISHKHLSRKLAVMLM